MFKVFTYYNEKVKTFFPKSMRSLASVMHGERLDLIILTDFIFPIKEKNKLTRFFNSITVLPLHKHTILTNDSDNLAFVNTLMHYGEHDRLYVDPTLFFINEFLVQADSSIFFKQHQGYISNKLCFLKEGTQFKTAFSAIRRTSISSITEQELTYVIGNNFLIPKKISNKQIVSGRLFNDSALSNFSLEGVVAIDTSDIGESISNKTQQLINTISRKQTLISLSSIKRKPAPVTNYDFTTTTTTTDDPTRKPFSILITAYNTASYIEECLDSIESQTYFKDNDDFEILIGVDGCQPTLDKLKEIRHKYRNLSIYMMLENSGTYITTNTLISLAKNENLIRFDSDDIMKPNLVQKVANHLHYDLVRLSYNNFYSTSQIESKINIAHGIIHFKKSMMDNVAGGYMAWKCGADTEFIQRIRNKITIINLIDSVFYRRLHSASLTPNPITGFESELRKNYKKQIKQTYSPEEFGQLVM